MQIFLSRTFIRLLIAQLFNNYGLFVCQSKQLESASLSLRNCTPNFGHALMWYVHVQNSVLNCVATLHVFVLVCPSVRKARIVFNIKKWLENFFPLSLLLMIIISLLDERKLVIHTRYWLQCRR